MKETKSQACPMSWKEFILETFTTGNLCKEEQATVHKSLPGSRGFVDIFVTAGMPSFVFVECFLLEFAATSSNARISG